MSDTYFVIHCSADGDVSVDVLSKELLLERLNPEEPHYGTVEAFDAPPTPDPQYWSSSDEGSKLLIIKGKIVTPREKRVITELDID